MILKIIIAAPVLFIFWLVLEPVFSRITFGSFVSGLIVGLVVLVVMLPVQRWLDDMDAKHEG
jgi:multisubunit Na+/H+ antiporter MnhE subunit